ncbi:MAG: transporter permease [Herbinix sp.]|jgi:ABC-2 type transport system permease protein|nr:transporter permease [Herbinix sp.]
MNTFFAFLKKEIMELIRSGRLTILLIVFILFGIMNPAIAKITPWMMETMAGSLKDTGLVVTEVKIDAITSWTQYYKNLTMALIIFVLFVSNSFTKEFQSGTLVLVLTKGLSRFKVIIAKALSMGMLWTLCYWICYGITYGYNAYFWDNSIAPHMFYGAFLSWLFGVWILILIVFFSTLAQSNTTVLLGLGGTLIVFNLLNMFTSVSKYLPIKLLGGLSLLTKEASLVDYSSAVLITVISSVLLVGFSVVIFNRKMI